MRSVRNTTIIFKLKIFWIFVCLIVTLSDLRTVESSSSTSSSNPTKANTQRTTAKRSATITDPTNYPRMTDIRMVFSDVDGTLVHYPDTIPGNDNDDGSNQGGNGILKLPPSATGMQGIISFRTLALCQDLRKRGIPLVLVSGMRTSTLLKRLPFLPKADAYCSEAGGRIFVLKKTSGNGTTQKSFLVVPQSLEGVWEEPSFEIVEDLEWRQTMQDEHAVGTDGYAGVELDMFQSTNQSPMPIANRQGPLWDFARRLVEKGYVLDTKGYASCFRVNRKQQTSATTDEDFERLLRGEAVPCPPELATSTNLGCIDYYPVTSGKKNCCQYLARKFLQENILTSANSNNPDSTNDLLSQHCVCMCDDDNDLEMALACQHAFIPGVSSTSMADVIANHPDHFSKTGNGQHEDVEGIVATEKALGLILERIEKEI